MTRSPESSAAALLLRIAERIADRTSVEWAALDRLREIDAVHAASRSWMTGDQALPPRDDSELPPQASQAAHKS